MRDAKNGEDVATAEGGWLDWLADCGVAGDRRRRHPRPRPPHPRPRRDARRHLPGRDRPRPRRASGSRPSPRWTAPTSPATVTPPEPVRFEGDGPHVVGIDTGIKLEHRPPAARARLPADAAALHSSAEEVLAEDPDLVFLANGPGDPAALDYVVDTVRELVGKRPVVRHLPRPPAALPRGRPRDLQAALRPPRRQPPGQGPGDRADRHHLPEPRLRGRGPGRRAARSRATSRCAGRPTSAPPSSPTSTSTTARSRAWSCATSPARTVQYHPEAGPGPARRPPPLRPLPGAGAPDA